MLGLQEEIHTAVTWQHTCSYLLKLPAQMCKMENLSGITGR